MDGLPFDCGPQLYSQRLVGDQIDWAAYEIFNVELHAEIPLRRCRAIEPHNDINVAVIGVLIARE